MSLSAVSVLFLVQMAFGSLLTFLVNDRAALGPKYYKVSGWILVALYGLALTLVAGLAPGATGLAGALTGATAAATALVLAFTSVSGWDRPRLETTLLWASVLAGGLAVAAATEAVLPADVSTAHRALAHGGALGSSLVLGFTIWGMILGHWYLVAPGLPIGHLARLVAPLPWVLGLKTVLSAAATWWLWDTFLGPGNRSLDDVLARQPERMVDVVSVFARIPVGLLIPGVLAAMTKVTVRMEKTQPATGILYAMCVLVLMGDLMGKLVEGGTGLPL